MEQKRVEILRRIDAWVAEVLGLNVRQIRDTAFIQERYRYEYWYEPPRGLYPQAVGIDGNPAWKELKHYTTAPNAAEEVEQWLFSLDAAITIEHKRNCLGVWRCFIYPSSSELLEKLPCCYSHKGAPTRTLALCLAILPEELREHYSKLLGECEDGGA